MVGRVRLFFWRHQKKLGVAYLGLLGLAWLGFFVVAQGTPYSIDIGAAVALRARAYHASFEDVRTAEDEIERGKLYTARRRLENYLEEHEGVARAQLHTHAVVRAHELLAGLYQRDNRPGRAVRLLKGLCERLPLHYRAWYLRGKAEKAAGDSGAASESFATAFRMTLNHPDVAEAYLGVLADLTEFDQIVWAADQFDRAARRAGPTALVKVGIPRGTVQLAGLNWAGIPIEHGTFFRSVEMRNLPRGKRQSMACPPELFRYWRSTRPTVTIQTRFEHVYSGLEVHGLRVTRDGKVTDVEIEPGDVRYYHHPHSGREAYAEFNVNRETVQNADVELIYSCPVHALSTDTQAIVDKARANAKRGG